VKILHVVPTYLPAWRHGGPIRAVHGLCRALAARGHAVTVFTTDVDTGGAVPVGQPVPLDGVEVWYFPVAAPRRLYRAPAMAVALAARLREVDLVHLHSVFLWPTAAAARAAVRAGVPYLLAPRGMLVRDLLRRRGRLRKALWIRLVERRTLARAAGFHATSTLEAEQAAELGLRLPPVFVVPNGVEPEIWGGEEAALAPPVRAVLQREPFLLFLGRLSWKKGLDRLVAALAHVPGATLALAGPDEQCRSQLERQARKLGVADRVVFLGPVDGEDRAALLHRATALVLPSYSENFGNAVLEAMAAGRPVVVTQEVGLAAPVEQSGAGVVVEGEPHRLGAALRDLIADPCRAAEMGRRGARLAVEQFGWEAIGRDMEAVYETAVRSAAPS
jgi:glycosyltransferase involved in cell wall biosynthesis